MNVHISDDIIAAIGNTPLVALDRFAGGLPGRVLAKLEGLNPAGSAKDRAAAQMILSAGSCVPARPSSSRPAAIRASGWRPSAGRAATAW